MSITLTYGQTPINPNSGANSGERVNLVSSSGALIKPNQEHTTVYKPVYEHKGNTLSADSGYLYENDLKQQFFEAFSNVVITQPSGTVIYANRLHYDATSQLAKLTGNVKMVDRNSVLTTNFLTYNMRSKIGTYTGGGRIISQTDTITSQRAFYFENQGEAFFSKKVIVRNPSVKVYTDSMRYYSISKDTHFFGPTNIKGNNKENLYTERGVYNTSTGVARFNKNNLYTHESKLLKGDSLHYDRVTGVGSAFRNVVFIDTLDKFYAYGNKGVYRQSEESILMTDKPYIVTVVKNQSDSVPQIDSTQTSIENKKEKSTKKTAKKETKKDDLKSIEKTKGEQAVIIKDEDPLANDEKIVSAAKVDSVFMTADTLYSRMILLRDYKPLNLNLNKDGGQLEEDNDEDYGDDEDNADKSISALTANLTDSTSEDSTNLLIKNETALSTPKTTDKATEISKAKKTESTKKAPTKPVIKTPIGLQGDRKEIENTIKADSILRQNAVIPKLNQADSLVNKALISAQKQDTVKKPSLSEADSAYLDTARTRIVKAFYNVRLYKSDLQAVADSVYYGMQDSMFRFMGNPMIWSQESQISADTIFMQIINNQMDNALLKENAFMVNATADSTRFNQLKGRKITAFFANNEIDKLFVDGNAENLVFSTNEKTKQITEMFHDRGGRIKVKLKDNEIIDYITIKKVDQKVFPFTLITQENEILPGFKWRPEDRPKSKEDLLNRKRDLQKASAIDSKNSDDNDEKTSSEDKKDEEVKGVEKKK